MILEVAEATEVEQDKNRHDFNIAMPFCLLRYFSFCMFLTIQIIICGRTSK